MYVPMWFVIVLLYAYAFSNRPLGSMFTSGPRISPTRAERRAMVGFMIGLGVIATIVVITSPVGSAWLRRLLIQY